MTGIEALENIKLCFKRIEEVSKDAREMLGMELIGKIDWNNIEEISIIEKELKRLEAIDNTKPSKALDELNEIIEYITEDKKVKYKATILFDCEVIKQSLLKAEKLEKAWEVVKRNVNVEIDYGNNRDISVALVFYIDNDKKVYIVDQATKEINPEHFEELENLKEMLE